MASVLGIAQMPSAAAQSSQNPAKPPATAAGPITIRGYISGGRQAYTLTQSSTGTTFALQGGAKTFAQYRGKLVELTARESPPASSTGLKELPRLSVRNVRVIAGQCPLEGKGTAAAKPGTQNPPTQTPAAATPRYQPPGAPNQTPPTVGNNPNVGGATGAPSPGTGNPPKQPPPPPPR